MVTALAMGRASKIGILAPAKRPAFGRQPSRKPPKVKVFGANGAMNPAF
jgi:hypothetical protein